MALLAAGINVFQILVEVSSRCFRKTADGLTAAYFLQRLIQR
jgi:hypothetical protein